MEQKIWSKFTSYIALVVYFVYAVVASFTVRESRKMRGETYHMSADGTLFVPLVVCEPTSIEVDGTVVSFDANDVGNCHDTSFLVSACAMSLIFSIAAMVIYCVLTVMADCGSNWKPFNKSSILGMGLFLIFILLQTTICLWALGSECRYWTGYYSRIYDKMRSEGNNYGVERVRTYGYEPLFWTTGALALVSAVLLLVTSIIHYTCGVKNDNGDRGRASSSGQNSKLGESAAAATASTAPASSSEFDSATEERSPGDNQHPSWMS